MTWLIVYAVVGLAFGALAYWRNCYHVDEEFFALVSSVAVFWPLWLAWDTYRAVREWKAGRP